MTPSNRQLVVASNRGPVSFERDEGDGDYVARRGQGGLVTALTGALSMTAFHPGFDRLFAFGIDPPQGELPRDEASDWPSLMEIYAYNRRIREKLDKVLDNVPEEMIHGALTAVR